MWSQQTDDLVPLWLVHAAACSGNKATAPSSQQISISHRAGVRWAGPVHHNCYTMPCLHTAPTHLCHIITHQLHIFPCYILWLVSYVLFVFCVCVCVFLFTVENPSTKNSFLVIPSVIFNSFPFWARRVLVLSEASLYWGFERKWLVSLEVHSLSYICSFEQSNHALLVVTQSLVYIMTSAVRASTNIQKLAYLLPWSHNHYVSSLHEITCKLWV